MNVFKKYAKAFNAFNSLTPQSPKIKLYQANCLIEQKEYDKAIGLLSEIDDNNNIKNGISENRDWYLAMAYLGNNNLIKAKAELTEISNSDSHIFKAKAKELLEVLNSK